ncbi:MAG: DNA polymerase III subunit delta [Bryobacteraceae bacterium]|nr:DNA polymerase III subunit delta [Bryobacteraceae bacterium]
MTPQQFVSQLRSARPAPVYLFLGPEAYRRRACRKLLVEKALPEDQREEGFSRYDLDETSFRDVLDNAASFSLFASVRLLWVSNAEMVLPRGNTAPDEKDATALAAYVSNPTPDTTIVFDAQRFTFDNEDKARLDRLRKFYAPIANVVEFQPYTPEEARKLAGDLASKAGLKIAPPLLEMLVDTLGSDASRIATELDKLAAFTGGREVTEADVVALAPDARSTTIFALVGALGRGDRAASLDLLQTLVRDGEYLPLALTFLSAQFRSALVAKEEGLRTPQQIQGHFSKLGVAMWPSRAQQVAQTLGAFSKSSLETALIRIYEADKAFRDRSPDDRLVMESLVLALTR